VIPVFFLVLYFLSNSSEIKNDNRKITLNLLITTTDITNMYRNIKYEDSYNYRFLDLHY